MWTGHHTSRKHFRTLRNTTGTLQVVSFLVFSARKTSGMNFMHPCTPHDIISAKTMPPSGRARPHLYPVQVWSKSDQRFLRYKHFCILPLFCWSDHYLTPEKWPQNWLHNNWSPSLPRPLLMPLLVHWQLGQHPSACLSMTGTPKMPITPSPYSGIPWRTASSSTASHQTVRTTSDMSLQPWEAYPWRCMHNGCLPAAKRNRKWPRWKLLPSLTKSNMEWHMTSTPMCALQNSKLLWPGWERTPKISLHTSRHWWTAARWSMMSIVSMNCITVSSMPTAMRESSLENLWPSHLRHPPASWLTVLWTTLPSNMPGNKSPTAPSLWVQSARTSSPHHVVKWCEGFCVTWTHLLWNIETLEHIYIHAL